MAEDKYDRVVAKAAISGLSSLSKEERYTYDKTSREVSPRGREARDIRDGKK